MAADKSLLPFSDELIGKMVDFNCYQQPYVSDPFFFLFKQAYQISASRIEIKNPFLFDLTSASSRLLPQSLGHRNQEVPPHISGERLAMKGLKGCKNRMVGGCCCSLESGISEEDAPFVTINC